MMSRNSSKLLRAAALAATLAAIAACASPYDANEPPEYRAGWADGCRSGLSIAGADGFAHSYARDEKRYKADPEYHDGWDTAFWRCRESASPMMF